MSLPGSTKYPHTGEPIGKTLSESLDELDRLRKAARELGVAKLKFDGARQAMDAVRGADAALINAFHAAEADFEAAVFVVINAGVRPPGNTPIVLPYVVTP